MKMNLKKYGNLVLLISLLAGTFWVIFSKLDMKNFMSTLKNSDPRYLLAGLLCMLVYWGIEAGILDILLKKVYPKTKYWTAFKITLVGQYYSFLTPFASGGQPAQLYEMKKDEIPLTGGTAVLVSKFILFQVTVTIYALVLTLYKLPVLMNDLKAASTFVFVGLLINTIGLGMIVMIAFNSSKMKTVISNFILWLSKIHVVKNPEKHIQKLVEFIDEYDVCLKTYKDDWLLTLGLFAASVIQVTAFFSITFFVYKALGLSGASIYHIVTLQALLYMAIAFIPSPGTVGAAEAGFALLLGSVFSANLIAVALLLWRGISYYFGLVVCGLFTLYLYTFDRNRKLAGQTMKVSA